MVLSQLSSPLKLPIKRKKLKRKNAVFPNSEERVVPPVPKSIETTASTAFRVGVFSELLQLPVDEELKPVQRSSSPIRPNKRTTPIQAYTVNHILKPKWRLIMPDTTQHRLSHIISVLLQRMSRSRFAKFIVKRFSIQIQNCIRQRRRKHLLLNRTKEVAFGNTRQFFHQRYNRAEWLQYRAVKEELYFRKDRGEKGPVIKNGVITLKICTPVTMT